MVQGSKFDFKGFKLLKASFSHLKDKPITTFTIASKKGFYNEKNHIYGPHRKWQNNSYTGSP